MIKNVTKKLILGVPAFAILGLLIYGFSQSWKLKGIETSDAAGWMQAIGSVFAIAVTGYGIQVQIRHTENQAREAFLLNQRNIVKSFIAELGVYLTTLQDIQEQIDNSTSVVLCGTLQMVFPSSSFRFPIYAANASQVWAISKDADRALLIGLYAELDMLFELIDQNSAIALKIAHDSVPSDETVAQLKGVFAVIQPQLSKAIPLIEDMTKRLQAQITD